MNEGGKRQGLTLQELRIEIAQMNEGGKRQGLTLQELDPSRAAAIG
jgi:hypothetical protein